MWSNLQGKEYSLRNSRWNKSVSDVFNNFSVSSASYFIYCDVRWINVVTVLINENNLNPLTLSYWQVLRSAQIFQKPVESTKTRLKCWWKSLTLGWLLDSSPSKRVIPQVFKSVWPATSRFVYTFHQVTIYLFIYQNNKCIILFQYLEIILQNFCKVILKTSIGFMESLIIPCFDK